MLRDLSHGSAGASSAEGGTSTFDPVELLTRTLTSVNEAVFVVETPERRIAACNPAAEAMFGYEEEELLGARTEILHLDEAHFERFDEKTRPVVADGQIYRGRFRMARKDGSEIETEHTISPLHVREGELKTVVSVVRDVSELRQAGAEIGRSNAQLRRLVRLSQRIGSRVDLDELYGTIVESAVELIPEAEAAALWLYRENSGEFAVRAWEGPTDRSVFEDVDPDRSELFRRVLEDGVTFRQNDTEFAERPHGFDPPIFEGVRAVLGVPVRLGDSPLGLLVACGFAEGELFGHRDEHTLELLAGQAATSIRNGRLVQQLHERSSMLIQAQETERRRIARELHDELGGQLSALDMKLEEARLAEDGSEAAIEEAQLQIRGLSDHLRTLILDLRPSALDELGLFDALEGYIERYQERTGVKVQLRMGFADGRRFREEVETALYRVVQEALTNVARHAGVREARVRLEPADGEIRVVVVDEGTGFDVEAVAAESETVGLSGMRERSALLGGRFEVDSAPGEGTRITVVIPVED